MKIVSWNCNGKFREKFEIIKQLNADIYVIQECENPAEIKTDKYLSFASNYLWNGESKHKGIGIFASSIIKLNENNWQRYCLRCFISAKINDDFDLVGVWACNPYIEEYYLYQSINLERYNNSTIIIGDFNSNKLWDKKHGMRNHSAVVDMLQPSGLISAYHYIYNEHQGAETIPTFYLHRNISKPYHIDHCFISKNKISTYKVCDNNEYWMKYSDHVPIILDV